MKTKRSLLKYIGAILVAILLFVNIGAGVVVAKADDKQETVDGNKPPKDYHSAAEGSVVQILLVYEAENGDNYAIQSGTGFLVSNSVVVTASVCTKLADWTKKPAAAYLSNQLGKNVTFDETDDKEWLSIAPKNLKVKIALSSGLFADAKILVSSADDTFVILTISENLTKQVATMTTVNCIQPGDHLSLYGYEYTKCPELQIFSSKDVLEIGDESSMCQGVEEGVVHHSVDYYSHFGTVGGPILDQYGRVVAVAQYAEGETGPIFSAIPIDAVREALDSQNIVYVPDDKDYARMPQVATSTDVIDVGLVNKGELYEVICAAETVLGSGNNGNYTQQSYDALETQYNKAVEVYDNPYATQSEVNTRRDYLEEAMKGIKKVKKKNIPLLIAIISGCSLVGIGLIVLLILFIRKQIRKKKEQEEAARIRTIENSSGISGVLSNDSSNLGLPSAQLYAQFGAKSKGTAPGLNTDSPVSNSTTYMEPSTTVLQDEEGTTVLNSFVQAPVNAYLYRSRTGENIPITNDNFRIGKNTEGVDYRVDGNTNISRFHAVITRNNEYYYIEDLGSTNYTFVNSVRVAANRKQQLQSNDVVYLADEEFIFIVNG